MALDKEQANIIADQIIRKAEQQSLAVRNAAARRARIPLSCRTKAMMSLGPYKRIQVLAQAKDQALEHPIYNKVLYIYIFIGFMFFRHVLKTSETTSTFDTYSIMALSFGLAIFESYRGYLVRSYVLTILEKLK